MRRDGAENAVYGLLAENFDRRGGDATQINAAAGRYAHKAAVGEAGDDKTDLVHVCLQKHTLCLLLPAGQRCEHISAHIHAHIVGKFFQPIARNGLYVGKTVYARSAAQFL